MTHDPSMVSIRLFGTFSVTGPNGEDLTPRGTKVQGLIALLATEPSFKRSRLWLQDKLWSSRDTQQASGSLRQALAELRRALAPYDAVLLSDRSTVALDQSRVAVLAAEDTPPEEREFLQGLDLRDPEFEDWLRLMRSYHRERQSVPLRSQEKVTPAPQRPPFAERRVGQVIVIPADGAEGSLKMLEMLFADLVTDTVRELSDFEILRLLPERPASGALLLTIQAFAKVERTCLRVTVESALRYEGFWSDHIMFDALPLPPAGDIDCLALCHRAVMALLSAHLTEQARIGRDPDYSVVTTTALRKVFSIRRQGLLEAGEALSSIGHGRDRGLHYAIQAQLAVISFVERLSDDIRLLHEQSDESVRRALETEPGNSVVLASAANARLFINRSPEAAFALARNAVQANATNPLAWWSLSSALLYSGDSAAAYSAAVTSQHLASRTSLRFWCDFQRSLTAAVTGRYHEAIQYGESAAALAPTFRPPLRYLTALYARVGNPAAAERTVRRLVALEPDFTPKRLIADPSYPASMVRKAQLIDEQYLKWLELEMLTP